MGCGTAHASREEGGSLGLLDSRGGCRYVSYFRCLRYLAETTKFTVLG